MKLKAVYKLTPPVWYNREVTKENTEDLNFFTGEKLNIKNNKIFVNGKWRSLERKIAGEASGIICVKFYNNWFKVLCS